MTRTSGGFKGVYALLARSTHDPEAVRIVEAWTTLIGARQASDVDLDQLLDVLTMTARDFAAVIFRCGWDIQIHLGQAIFVMQYPAMMQASMKRATQVKGTDERKLHFQATGHVPTSKGIQIGISNTNIESPPEAGQRPSFRRIAREVVRDVPPVKADV